MGPKSRARVARHAARSCSASPCPPFGRPTDAPAARNWASSAWTGWASLMPSMIFTCERQEYPSATSRPAGPGIGDVVRPTERVDVLGHGAVLGLVTISAGHAAAPRWQDLQREAESREDGLPVAYRGQRRGALGAVWQQPIFLARSDPGQGAESLAQPFLDEPHARRVGFAERARHIRRGRLTSSRDRGQSSRFRSPRSPSA